jgi:RimJ/RimL family protein N-acetyltransferase
MVEIDRLSGYRLYKEELPPEQLAYRWHSLRNEVEKYSQLLQGLDFGYYLDDGDRNINIVDLLMSKLNTGELYFVFTKGRKEFVGIASINQIAWGRNAYIEAIATAPARGSFSVGQAMGEILTYAFQDFGAKGLGLKKLKATVSTHNISVAQMLANAGFKPLTVLRGEGLMGGAPQDIILLEMLNPKYFHVEKQVIENERSPEHPGVPHDQLQQPGTSLDGIEHAERTSDVDTSSVDAGGISNIGSRTELVEPEQLQRDIEPVSTGGTGGSLGPTTDDPNAELVHAERSPTPSISSPSTDATGRTKLRKLRGRNGRADASAGAPELVPSGISS